MKQNKQKPRFTVTDCYTKLVESTEPRDSVSFMFYREGTGISMLAPHFFLFDPSLVDSKPFKPILLKHALVKIRTLFAQSSVNGSYETYTKLQDGLRDAYHSLTGWRYDNFLSFIADHADESSYFAEFTHSVAQGANVCVLVVKFAEAPKDAKRELEITNYRDPFEQEGKQVDEATYKGSGSTHRPTAGQVVVMQKSHTEYNAGSFAQFDVEYGTIVDPLEGYNEQLYKKCSLTEATGIARKAIEMFACTSTVTLTTMSDFRLACRDAFFKVLNWGRSSSLKCEIEEFLELYGGCACLIYVQPQKHKQACTLVHLQMYLEEKAINDSQFPDYVDPFETESKSVKEASYATPPGAGIVQGKNVNSFGPNPTGFKGSPFGQELLVNLKVQSPKGKQSNRRLRLLKRNNRGSKQSSVSRKALQS